MDKIFITGIGTDVGKTIVSAIVVEALEADYWKPIQAGELEFSDSEKVNELISNSKSKIHPNSYALQSAMSPHAAADIDGVSIQVDTINPPETLNKLVIEGAGGLLVPLNRKDTILDIIRNDYKIIIVSRHYLGSINHSLMTIKTLQSNNLNISGIIFCGDENPTTESIIEEYSGVKVLGRINEEEIIDQQVVKRYAKLLKPILENL